MTIYDDAHPHSTISPPLSHVLAHEPPMEITPQGIVYELLALALVLRPARLVLEHHIVVPPPPDREVRLVQQRVPLGDVALPLSRLGRRPLPLLPLPLLLALALDPLQLPLQLRLLVAVVVAVAIAVVVVVIILIRPTGRVRVVCVDVPRLL